VPYIYGLKQDWATPLDPNPPGGQEIGVALLLTLNLLNAADYSGVGIGATTGVTHSSFGPSYAVYFGDVIQQSCATLDGPDFSIVPCEPLSVVTLDSAGHGIQIGTLNFYSHLGAIDPNTATVFEYGIGQHNVQAYQRQKTKANIANNVLSLPQGYPSVSGAADIPGLIIARDDASIAALTEFDYILEGENIVDRTLRTALAKETLAVTKQAQQQITFTPSVDCNLEFGTDYSVGDLVQARAYNKETNTLRYNGLSRVYGVNITVDDKDAETTALTLIPGG
jgi:hypothetical protein